MATVSYIIYLIIIVADQNYHENFDPLFRRPKLSRILRSTVSPPKTITKTVFENNLPNQSIKTLFFNCWLYGFHFSHFASRSGVRGFNYILYQIETSACVNNLADRTSFRSSPGWNCNREKIILIIFTLLNSVVTLCYIILCTLMNSFSWVRYVFMRLCVNVNLAIVCRDRVVWLLILSANPQVNGVIGSY